MHATLINGLKLFSLAALIALSSCHSFSPNSAASTADSASAPSWPQREKQLQAMSGWQLQGVIGVQQTDKNESASFNWQQLDAQHYTLRLFGPFGAGAVDIQGGPSEVSLVSSSQPKPVYSSDAQTLIAQQTGWNMPVRHLYYWVRGLPATGVANRTRFDSNHRLSTLQQDGWEIEYLSYSNVNGIDLPNKIKLTNADFKVKMVIKRWGL